MLPRIIAAIPPSKCEDIEDIKWLIDSDFCSSHYINIFDLEYSSLQYFEQLT